MIEQFLELPLWVSVPLVIIYVGVVVSFCYTIYYYSDWRLRRMKKNQNNKNTTI